MSLSADLDVAARAVLRTVGGMSEIPDNNVIEPCGHMAAIVASSDDAIVSKRLDGTVTSWNPAAERLFGFSATDMIGHSIAAIIPADRLPEEMEIIRRIAAGTQISHYDTVRRRKDGRLVDVSLTISPIRDARGHIVGASKIARDITDRKRAEEISLRFISVVDSAMDAIISVDERQRVILFNPAAERMFGCRAAEAIDGPVDRFMPPRFREQHGRSIARFSETGAPSRPMGALGEIFGMHVDGREIPLEASISQATVAGKRSAR